MMMNSHRHLSDDELLNLHFAGATEHGCSVCEQRRADLAELLAEVSTAVGEEADGHFPAERLARQQARILGRIEQDGRPGRVITFPNYGQDAFLLRGRPASRWIAAAAAAGLVIGLLAGHLAHDLPGREGAASVASAPTADLAPSAFRAVVATFSEDEFLGQLELAADSPGGITLRPLHDATPSAWEDLAR
jgi:hypothetical protein